MTTKTPRVLLFVLLINMLAFPTWKVLAQRNPKKVYLSFILHGNMNYDRYVKSTIWRDFPVIYDNLLDYIEERPDFKGQLQLSGQTFNSLKQTAPHVIEHALELQKKGQLNFTGTFYSEPVNVSMDGETNYRCAKLGTSIIADAVGSTDGYYLQERAYHAQLPWILNHSNVSWVPVITGDEESFPFKLRGMDGSVTTCVPIIARNLIVEKAKAAPANSLLTIEGDYEIPQSFTTPYERLTAFDKENEDIEIEWITVKEYIKKFGVNKERYIDGTAKARDLDHGTYSRWTADPLDILVQDYTNKAMADFRVATMMNALVPYLFQQTIDEPISQSTVTLKEDPLIWNIEQAVQYPDVEPTYFARNGQVTLMSRIEHLLVWAVNSDSRGWWPLYERRRERINSFENCSALSREIINRGLDVIAGNLDVKGYDKYFILFNAEPARTRTVKLNASQPFEVYDYTTGNQLRSTAVNTGGEYTIEAEIPLPDYGYKVIGLKQSGKEATYGWTEGAVIENDRISLSVTGDQISVMSHGTTITLSVDSFMIKTLAEMTVGTGDDVWRKAVPYGPARVSVRKALYPQLRVEKQLDWLVHMQQVFTLLPDRIAADIDFVFPHPTLVRKTGPTQGATFDPRGLTMQFRSDKPGKVFYDIPFGISPHNMTSLSYFCPLSTCIFQWNDGDGFMITAGTGEQAFYTHSEAGEVGFFMGASTSSGPNRNVGMTLVNKGQVDHDPAWYAEPFHGTYHHQFLIFPFEGSWQQNHASAISRSYTQPVYLRAFYPSGKPGILPVEKSLVSLDQKSIEITSIDYVNKELHLRLNDKEGKETQATLGIGEKTKKIRVPAHGILDVKF